MAIQGSASFGGSHIKIDTDKTTGHTVSVAENKFNLIENNANIYNTNLGATNKGLTVATSGSSPTTHTIVVNNGTITGAGGRGALNGTPSITGENGGDAVETPVGLRIINMMSSGNIQGGGGGGGRGAAGESTSPATSPAGATSSTPYAGGPSSGPGQNSPCGGGYVGPNSIPGWPKWYPSPSSAVPGPGYNLRGTHYICTPNPGYPPRWSTQGYNLDVSPTHPGLSFNGSDHGPSTWYPGCVAAMHFVIDALGVTTSVKPTMAGSPYGGACYCDAVNQPWHYYLKKTKCLNTVSIPGCPPQTAPGAAAGSGGIGSPGGTYGSTIVNGSQGGNGGSGTSLAAGGCEPASRAAAPAVSTLPGGAGGDGGRGGAAGQPGGSGYLGFAKNNRVNPTSYGGGTYSNGETAGGSAGARAPGATIIE